MTLLDWFLPHRIIDSIVQRRLRHRTEDIDRASEDARRSLRYEAAELARKLTAIKIEDKDRKGNGSL